MKRNRSFMDTFFPCLKCLLYFLVYYLVVALIGELFKKVLLLFGKNVPSSLVGVVAYIFVILVFALSFIPFKTNLFKEAQINKPKVRFIIDGALLGVGFLGAYQLIYLLISKLPFAWIEKLIEIQKEVSKVHLEGETVFFVLYLAIIAPICEELVFRGLMLSAIKDYIPKWAGIIVCALCFGVIHYPSPIAMVVTFGFGILLGFVFYRTGSLVPCILAHMLFNSSNFLLFIPYDIGFYILVIACIPLLTYSIIDIVRKTRG